MYQYFKDCDILYGKEQCMLYVWHVSVFFFFSSQLASFSNLLVLL